MRWKRFRSATSPVLLLLILGCADGEPPHRTSSEAGLRPDEPASPERRGGSGRETEASDDTSVEDTVPSAGRWTAGTTSSPDRESGVATLTELRIASHPEFDRTVLRFAGETIPGFHIEYVDRPVRRCGSGHVVEIAGDGWLRIRLAPARAHDEDGQVTVQDRDRRPELPVVREAVLICDFEAHVEWVLGVRSPEPYRVLELASPARLVVDVSRP